VIHFDLPDSLEAYYQEAGRAGRDDRKSYAILMYCESDILDLKKNLENAYPSIEEIKNVYNCLGNYYKLAVGSGNETGFDFDITEFSISYNLKPLVIFNSLKFLEKEGYLMVTDSIMHPSTLHIVVDKETLYRFQVENKAYDNFIKTILRSYGGVFSDYVKISETEIASRCSISKETTEQYLRALNKLGIASFVPRKEKPQIIYCRERVDTKNLFISDENYQERKTISQKKIESVIQYAASGLKCRSQILLQYFGENDPKRCGQCDVCLERNKLDLNEIEFDRIIDVLKPALMKGSCSIDEAVKMISGISEDRIIKAIQWLVDNNKIEINGEQRLFWKK
jgi:ATP-dependent DNA helicase RecQ